MLVRKLRFWLATAKRRGVLEEEMQLHLDEKTAELREMGLGEREARAEARRRFGNLPRITEEASEVWTVIWLDLLLRDIRYAVRTLRRNPGFTAALVLTLALGIGANTAIFSILDHVLFRSLPYADAEQLVLLYETRPNQRNPGVVSTATWLDWQKQSRSFEALAAWGSGEFSWQSNLTGDGYAERLNGQFVSEEFFPLLRVQPALGHVFSAENHRPGDPQVVILSHGLWKSRYGADPGVIGRKITLEGLPAEVIGVMPAGFQFVWAHTDFWAPLRVNRSRDYRAEPGNTLDVVGRLKPSVTVAQAQTELRDISRKLEELYPSNGNASARIVPLREELIGDVATSLWVLYAAVGVLLFIACSNFAGLLAARSVSRRPEITLRAALGAGRSTFLREALAEGLLLALAGGIVGLMVARTAIVTMTALIPEDLIEIAAAPLDGRVLLYTLCLSLLTGIVFGLVPALGASRVALSDALRTRSGGARRTGLRQALVMVQIALTVVLLCVSGPLARSLRELLGTDTGIDPEGVLSLNVGLDGEPYDLRQQQYVSFYQMIFERLGSLPGVKAVSAAQHIPVIEASPESEFRIQGDPELPVSDRPRVHRRMIAPDYFRALGIRLLRGRDFSANDRRESPLAFIVNTAFVNTFLRGSEPLGTSISIGSTSNPYGSIVGIVGDVKENSIRGHVEPTVFYAYSQIATSTDMFAFVKADNPEAVAVAARDVIHDIDPNVPVYQIRLLEDVFGATLARDKLNAVLSSAFALTALLLAASGVYGLLSFQVAERTQEIGIRMALGGQSREVLGLVLRQSLWLIIPGVAVGVAGGLAIVRLTQNLLYGVSVSDLSTYMAAVAWIIGVGGLASFVPALRATRVDPLTALRQE